MAEAAEKNRIVYSRGPIIRTLEIINAMVGAAAIAALVISLGVQQTQIDAIQEARVHAAYDSCILLRGLVFAASPQSKQQQARNYINLTPLHDCTSYARGVK